MERTVSEVCRARGEFQRRFATHGYNVAVESPEPSQLTAVEGVRMIAISALPQENLEERALAAGCAEFYRKPIDPAKLEQLLSETPPSRGVDGKPAQ